MVKHTQTIRRLLLTNCLSVFEHFERLALKGLRKLGQSERQDGLTRLDHEDVSLIRDPIKSCSPFL